ncbi:MAG: hypothetical protein J5885_05055 [Clostridia bacterium]|nr:hypothetical protein [Clostridia bacterium]
MNVNRFSPDELKNICLHDKIIGTIQFDRLMKKMIIPIMPENEHDTDNTIHEMIFSNVLGYEITTCDFWCPSPHIFSFSFLSKEEERLIPKYYKKWCAQNDSFHTPENFPGAKSFEVLFEFTSGDTLSIACEELFWE